MRFIKFLRTSRSACLSRLSRVRVAMSQTSLSLAVEMPNRCRSVLIPLPTMDPECPSSLPGCARVCAIDSSFLLSRPMRKIKPAPAADDKGGYRWPQGQARVVHRGDKEEHHDQQPGPQLRSASVAQGSQEGRGERASHQGKIVCPRLFAHSKSHMFNHSRPYIYQASTNGWTCVSPHTWRWPTISGGGGLHVCTMHACMGLRGTRFD